MARLDAQLKTAPDDKKGLTLSLDGQASGLAADDAAVTAALGEHAHVTAQGTFTAQRQIALDSFSLDGPAAQLRFDGHADAQTVSGKLQVARLDLGVAAPLAGQRLGGQLAMNADIDSAADFRSFAIALDGHLDNFSSATPALDGLLVPSLKLAGTLKRDANGAIVASNMTASSAMLQATLDGRLDQAVANLKAHAVLADIAKLDGRLSGKAEIDASFSGSLDHLGLQATLSIPQGKAMGRDIEGLTLTLKSSDITGQAAGDIALDGRIGGKPATGHARLTTAADGSRKLEELTLSVGSVNAKGTLSQAPDGRIAGDIALKAGNLDDLAPLTLTALGGQLDATVKFDTDKSVQRIAVDATASGLRASGSTVGSARIKLTVLDPLGTPKIDGTADLANVRSGWLVIDKATLAASNAQGGTALKLTATSLGASVDATATLSAQGNASVLNLSALTIVKDGATATLAKPATITIGGGTTRIDGLVLNANGGSVAIAGTAGNALNLTVELHTLPLSLAAVAAPEFDASGTVSGKLTITGSAAAPGGQYDLAVAKASTRALARAGLGPFDAKARGTIAGNKVTIDGTISAPSLQGIRVAGAIPLGHGELDLTVKGEAGLNLVNTALATTGAYAAGKMTIDASIKGTTDAPQASGTIRIVNGSFNDAINGMAFDKIDGEIVAQGRDIAIRSFTAHTADGGTVQAQGNVTLDPAAGFPGNVQITMQKARLLSNETVRLVADAKLALSGPLGTGPRLSGRIDVRSLDINIPDKLPGSLQATDVRHINVPQSQQAAIQTPQTKAKALRKAQAKANPQTAPMVITLDLTIAAPARVFVRGRGIDAELGGTVRLSGTTDNPVTNGGFDLRRGRLDIGQRQLNFSRGKISFRGSTDPELDLSADSQSADVTATVHITGHASAPQISFTSTPNLPQDEVLARLLFGKPAGALTPGQAIQLARTIAQFSGSGTHPLDDVRRSLGISSLDIGTGANGTGGQVGVGKRLNDNVYLGVSQGTTTGSGQVSVDVDVMKNIKVTGKAGATGGEVGIGAEWDY
jgi:translocation and assembly module TamB